MSDHLPLFRRIAAGLALAGAVLLLAGISFGRALHSSEIRDIAPAYGAAFLLGLGPLLLGHGGLLLRAFDELLHRHRDAIAAGEDPARRAPEPALRGRPASVARAIPIITIFGPPALVAVATLVYGLGGGFMPGAVGSWSGSQAGRIGAEAVVQIVAVAAMALVSITALVALRVPGKTLASAMLGLSLGTIWTPWYLAGLVAVVFGAA